MEKNTRVYLLFTLYSVQNAVVDSRLPTGVRVTLYLGPKEQIVSLNDTEYLRGYLSNPLGTKACERILRTHSWMGDTC
jgi:hypothetical protein